MSVEVAVTICVGVAGLIGTCVSVGVAYGLLRGKVDTLQRDVNNAFKMIREIQNTVRSNE